MDWSDNKNIKITSGQILEEKYLALTIKYNKLIDFLKLIENHSCCLCAPECCIACNAKDLLEEREKQKND